MNILITGAGTLLGNTVVKKLSKKNYNLIATYRKTFPNNLKKNKIKIFKLDLESKKIIFNFKIDCLIHCASAIPSYNLSDKMMQTVNTQGYKKLLKASINSGCKKIILISSMSVYGKINQKTINLKTKRNPVDAYGISKLNNENDTIALAKKKKLNILF